MSKTVATHSLPSGKPRPRRRWALLGLLLPGFCLSAWLAGQAYHWLTFRPTGVIAFECRGEKTRPSGRYYLWLCLIDADGRNRRWLVTGDFDALSPAWSPDGEQLAFIRLGSIDGLAPSLDYPFGELFVIDADGTGLRQITPDGVLVASPVWMPHSDRILVQAEFDQGPGLYLIRPKPGNLDPMLVIQRKRTPVPFAVAPDGIRIIYYSATPSPGDYTIGLNGATPQLFSPCNSPDWAPNGELIVCERQEGLVIVDVSGQVVAQLHGGWFFTTHDTVPSWSPDGKYIVYRQEYWPGFLGPNGELWIMKADGSQPTKLTSGPIDRNPDWRPVP